MPFYGKLLKNLTEFIKNKFKAEETREPWIFDEKYRISTEDMIELIYRISDVQKWEENMTKDSHSLVNSINLSRHSGGSNKINDLHVGWCHHAIGSVTTYLIRDELTEKTLFAATKFDGNDSFVDVFCKPGNWIECLQTS